MSKILCHQYTTGRGTTGYGFVAFSKSEENDQNPSYSFSPSKGMGLRFSQMPDAMDCVMEIDPASTDYRHIGAFMTKKREEAGSSSIYTHVLITADEQTELPEIFGLLKEENFLTPDEFTEITLGHKALQIEGKNAELTDYTERELNDGQKITLSEFLARYWRLLEQREWARKNDNAEIALLLPGKDNSEKIALFAKEIVKRIPKHVRPAVSVSFGARWSNKGSTPCVCCVLPDENENPFPCYDLINGRSNSKKASDVEKEIGKLLLLGDDRQYPETYLRISKLADTDNRFRNMARGFTLMAYCVSEGLPLEGTDDPVQKKKEIYLKLLKLAKERYGIEKEEVQFSLLPILEHIFLQINKNRNIRQEEKEWLIREGMSLHSLEIPENDKPELKVADEQIIVAYSSLPIDQMTSILNSLREELYRKDQDYDKCFDLLRILEEALLTKINDPTAHASVRTGLDQCNRLTRDVPEKAKDFIYKYKEWLLKSENKRELLLLLRESTTVDTLEESLLFELLDTKEISEGENAEDLTAFLAAMKSAKAKNIDKANEILAKAYQGIITKAAKYKNISDADFQMIAEYALSQQQTTETIEPAIDFAIQNSQKKEAADYLGKIKFMMAASEAASEKVFRDMLFIKLNETFRPFNRNPEEDDEAIQLLLKKSNNQIPDGLENINGFKTRSLTIGLNRFIEESELEDEQIQQNKWDEKEKAEFDCSWDALTNDQFTEPVGIRMKELFDSTENAISFLEKINKRFSENPQSAYGEALKTAWLRIIRENYDAMWKKADSAGDEQDSRMILDKMVDQSGDEKLIEACKKTTAGRAKVFLINLEHCLGNDYDLGKRPEEAGKLIKTLRDEKDFPEYIRLDEKIGSQEINDQNTLAQALIKQLSIPQNQGSSYWNNILDIIKGNWKDKNDPMRMLNMLSFISQCLERMKTMDLGKDLKNVIGETELARLWSEKTDKTLYCGNGKKVLSETLVNLFQIK